MHISHRKKFREKVIPVGNFAISYGSPGTDSPAGLPLYLQAFDVEPVPPHLSSGSRIDHKHKTKYNISFVINQQCM